MQRSGAVQGMRTGGRPARSEQAAAQTRLRPSFAELEPGRGAADAASLRCSMKLAISLARGAMSAS